MQRIAVGRTIGTIIAIAGIAASIHFAGDCVRRRNEFHRWVTDRPMETAVDLSKSGSITVPFRQTCSISHGEAICLEITPNLDDNQEPEELLKELVATVVIKDPAGKEIEKAEITHKTIYGPPLGKEDIILTGVSPFRNGEYAATIRVESGVPALADRKQVIYAKYQLCGLEQFPALIAGALSFGSGLVGLIGVVCVLPGLLRDGLRPNRPAQSDREPEA